MDLHGIVSGVIGTINPFTEASYQASTGFTTDAAGKQSPSYAAPITVSVQVQALTFRDLQQIAGIDLQGTRRAIYIEGPSQGIVRSTGQGGDLITISSGVDAGVWLVAQVLEAWPDWTKVAVTLQDGS